jgi:prolyl-tRNA synthetase
MVAKKTAISPTRNENFPEWYQQVVRAADLAETSAVRGCMIIKPWGYGLWENIQKILDKKIKETGHKNVYFPLFIPLSLLNKEAKHVEGFAKECAVVTHHRLEKGPDGNLIPASPLDEPLVVRPTSETIIGETFASWVQSYRDLPILINQWANIVRWEMRPRVFLRTVEFLWQEGHTVHSTEQEALEETRKMLQVYVDFCRDYLAIPVLSGVKTESEKFPGAVDTYCIEAMMQDKKGLQAGTSHFLGQNFAKASNIRYRDEDGNLVYGWMTSWGVTTRLIGGLIMIHSDDDGMIVPPRIAPQHIVILPVIHDEAKRDEVLEYCNNLVRDLQATLYHGEPIRVEIDNRDMRGGEKSWSWVKKGVPIRVEVGPRDIEKDSVFAAYRYNQERKSITRQEFINTVIQQLDDAQAALLLRAQQFLAENTKKIDSKDKFYKFFTPKNSSRPEIHGGFALTHWNGSPEVEEQIKKDLNVTIRCIPVEGNKEPGICPFTGESSKQRVIFAKAY